MDGWMHGWMDVMYVCVHGCMHAWMDVCMDVWISGCMDIWMYGWMDECMSCNVMYVYSMGRRSDQQGCPCQVSQSLGGFTLNCWADSCVPWQK